MKWMDIAPVTLALAAGAIVLPVFGQRVSFLTNIGKNGEEFDNATSIAVDSGALYVGGWRSRPASQPTAFLSRYGIDGQLTWTNQLVQSSHTTGVAVDADGVYVAGNTSGALPGQRSSGNLDAMLVKYSKDGDLLWGRQFGTAGPDSASAVASSRGYIYVSAALIEDIYRPVPTLRKYDTSGTELWVRQISDFGSVFGLAADGDGVYVVGQLFQGSFASYRGYLRRYDPAGAEVWTRELVQTVPFSAAVNATGVYLVGEAQGNHYVWKYDLSGQLLWQRPAGRFRVSAPEVDVDDTGVYVHVSTGDTLPGQCSAGGMDAALTKYTFSGTELWTRQFGSVGHDRAAGLALGKPGLFLATGFDLEWGKPGFIARIETSPAPTGEARPRIQNECVLNAASYEGGAVAPGEIVTILGSGIGPDQPAKLDVTPDGRVPSTLGETRVLFDGVAAQLLYASGKQTTALVPYEMAGRRTVDVVVEHRGVRSEAVTMPVLESRPGIFTQGEALDSSGARLAAVVNQDGTLNSLENPAALGTIVSIYGTGEGLTNPVADQALLVRNNTPRPVLPVMLAIGSEFEDSIFGDRYFPAQVLYAGGVPGSVAGLLQINARIPEGMPTRGKAGYWNLNLTIGKEGVREDIFAGRPIYIAVR